MRLLTRISLYYFLVSLGVFLLAGFTFYYAFRDEVYEELDEHLRDEKRNIERMLEASGTVPSFYPGVNTEVMITPVADDLRIKTQRKDTIIEHSYEGSIPFRQWRYTVSTDNGNYLVVLRKSLIDLEDLSGQIIKAMLYGFIALMLGSLLVNYLLLRRTLRPFRHALQQLRKYSLDNTSRLVLHPTSTKEFAELNRTLEIMTRRIQEDYRNVKEFTENASHEMQTPLAIIKNKLELLMQAEHINEEQAALIQAAYEAADRLSRLNQSLILLTRIENREFTVNETVDIGGVIRKILEQMQEQFALKGLSLKLEEAGSFQHAANRTLMEILVSNLLTNAVRHTSRGGDIIISINKRSVIFSNPGLPLPVPAEKLFERFYKSDASAESMGIGLSLVKKIADAHQLKVSYSYSSSRHIITLSR